MTPASAAAVVALVALSAAGVTLTRPILCDAVSDVKLREDVYSLPPPEYLKVMTLGYDAAAVDQIWGKLLVDYGQHWHDHRAFPDVPRYLDAMLALEPTYRSAYKYASTFLLYRPTTGTEEDAWATRRYLEQGIAVFPQDHEMWSTYGEFLAYGGTTFLESEEEVQQWKKEGALAMLHAVDLGADAYSSRSAATILGKQGERDAAVRALKRALYIAEAAGNEAEKEKIIARLGELGAEDQAARENEDAGFIWRPYSQRAFLPRADYLLVYPLVHVARCVGFRSSWFELGELTAGEDVRDCARSWDPRLPSSRAPVP